MTNLKKSLILLITLGSISSVYSSTITPSGKIISGARRAPTSKTIGGQGGVYQGQKPIFPLFNSLEITGPAGEVGAFYPVLRIAFLQNKDGDVTYFTNVTPKAPASDVASVYTQNFATATVQGRAVPLHAIVLTPELTTKIKTHYSTIINTIPMIAANASTLKNKTVGELWDMILPFIGTLLPNPTA